MNTPRIQLREHALEDMEPFYELQMDPDVAQYVSWLPRTRKQCEAALLDAIDQQTVAERVRYFFAATLQTTGEMIGSVGYTMAGTSSADCGWFLRRQFWGKGYASDAVRSMVSLALRDRRLERLNASCRLENRSSLRVADNCGFRLVRKTLERAYFEMVVRGPHDA
jgi:RimJ/RimL family protein N-acetyltransferase